MKVENFTISPIVSGLQSYVEANKEQIITKAVLGFETAKYAQPQLGIKSGEYLTLLTAAANPKQRTCAFEADSTSTLSNKKIEVGQYSVQMEFCDTYVLGKVQEWRIKTAATAGETPFEEYLTTELSKSIAFENEKKFWQGSTTVGATIPALKDGIVTQALADSAVIDYDASSVSTKIAQINNTVNKMPAATKLASNGVPTGTPRIFVSPEYQEAYIMELVAANMYHYDVTAPHSNEIRVAGTNVIVTAVPGMTGSSYAVAMNDGNLYLGTDMLGDTETFDIWFSKDARTTRFDCEYNLGGTYAFGDQIVLTKTA